ncbi:ArsR/SmtB family transcription factor [Microbacterium gorillae]|uniref:ArsR/SmtB family transcription factor n=1 Tax=Microbacterium gorillae TaxID=1231063 RepID=UPI00058EE031|nr:helix-turn-helix domain-containing protein [Microbacterium gorillae]
MSTNETPDATLSAAAMRAMSHPLRLQILDALDQRGPQTASSLARMVGESSGATSYHLRALAKHQLVVEDAERGTARERWWRMNPDGLRMELAVTRDSASERATAELLMMEMFRTRNDHLLAFLRDATRHGGTVEDRDATLMTSSVRLTLEQFAQIARELTAVMDRAKEIAEANGEDGGVLYSLRADLFPLDAAESTSEES